MTPYPLVDRDELMRDLEETGTRGFAIDRRENFVGVTASPCVSPSRLRRHQRFRADGTKHSIERMAPVSSPGAYPWS